MCNDFSGKTIKILQNPRKLGHRTRQILEKILSNSPKPIGKLGISESWKSMQILQALRRLGHHTGVEILEKSMKILQIARRFDHHAMPFLEKPDESPNMQCKSRMFPQMTKTCKDIFPIWERQSWDSPQKLSSNPLPNGTHLVNPSSLGEVACFRKAAVHGIQSLKPIP